MISDTADRGLPFIVVGVPLGVHGIIKRCSAQVETCDSSGGCSCNVRIFRRA
jgi:hypothetical protein